MGRLIPSWFWRDAAAPFAVSRAALLGVAWFARHFHPYHLAPAEEAARGWALVPVRMLDVWARYDSNWYLAIATGGYAPGPLVSQNRLAFYPLYPSLLGGVHALLPRAWQGPTALVVLGVAISNAFALAAVAMLGRYALARSGDEALARRAVWYLLAFPTAFFLSCVYTESLFLFLAVGSFHLAHRRRWGAAGALAALAALTRPTGALLLPPLAWLAWRQGRGSRLPRGALALALVPLAFGGWAVACWRLTGDPLAFLHVQAYWGRSAVAPWTAFARAIAGGSVVPRLDAALTVLTLALGAAMLWRRDDRPEGLFTVLCVAAFAFGGTLASASRYVLVAFPVYPLVARAAARSETLDRAWLVGGAAFQALLLAAWARFYWVG